MRAKFLSEKIPQDISNHTNRLNILFPISSWKKSPK